MAKYLISFLGTGGSQKDGQSIREYRTAKYSIDGKLVGESSFVSSVLMDHFKLDGLILVGTTKSMWEEVYRYYCEKNEIIFDEDIYFPLAQEIETANHSTNIDAIDLQAIRKLLGEKSKAVVIPYGLNKSEQIVIFSQIAKALESLQSGDEIILDVTHSFRSLPLFTTAVINYIHSLNDKDIHFEKVYYGMLDAMKEFGEIAPIVDISTSLELQKWATAAYAFKEYGKGQLLADLLGGEEGKLIQIFSDAVNINYLHEIKVKLTNFQAMANKGFENEFAQWVVPEILKSFSQRLQKAGQSQYKFQYELSVWHFEKQNFGSAYLVFTESIITYVCEIEGWEWMQMSNREKAKQWIVESDVCGLKKIYNEANKPRKNIAHSLDRRGEQVRTDIDGLSKLQKEFLKIIKSK